MPIFQLGLFLLFAVIQPSVIAVSALPQSSCSTVYECICANTTKDVDPFNGLAHCDNCDKMVYVSILTYEDMVYGLWTWSMVKMVYVGILSVFYVWDFS